MQDLCEVSESQLEKLRQAVYFENLKKGKKMALHAEEFTQANLVGVINRANDILESLRVLRLSDTTLENICRNRIENSLLEKDEWELAAWSLVSIELLEVKIRKEDVNVDKRPPGFKGGFANADLS